MDRQTYRGVIRGGTVVIVEEPVPLTDGTPVLVTQDPEPPGSPAAVIRAVMSGPPLPKGWVDELERLIAGGEPDPAWGADEPDERVGPEAP
ncbi:MAG TPA: hypothetical protein VKA46_21820 [Gemmataceae bacterium]|nr:hypothetical protein [Gemmataceae bacterium]